MFRKGIINRKNLETIIYIFTESPPDHHSPRQNVPFPFFSLYLQIRCGSTSQVGNIISACLCTHLLLYLTLSKDSIEMKIFTTQSTKLLDRLTIEYEPVSSIDLMERAAYSRKERPLQRIPGEKSPRQGAAYREKQSFSNPARRERQREKAQT